MGDGDVNISRGLDRSEAPQMSYIIDHLHQAGKILAKPETTHAEALVAAGEALVAAEQAIRELNTRRFSAGLDNPLLRGTGYRTELDAVNKEMRLSMFHGARDNVLAWMTVPIEEVYVMGNKILMCYDKLEGIK